MKLAITTMGTTLDDAVDPRFGRATGLLIVDTTTGAATPLAVPAAHAVQGAGLAAAEALVKAGAKALLTGAVGPKAARALEAAGIAVYQGLEGQSARAALERFNAGALTPENAPRAMGHAPGGAIGHAPGGAIAGHEG
ncbi:NifB/NifX family molybdenum-iron cluster-binding protein [Pararhodospirillum oryzae]|uniref:Dinitrogenase iron-molybdenum cofactor biosynthesis domain-containing protein n=1 Tax=Pararhodospirillum oryzae TaxID=478448 RepID=A0A512H8Y3_9PROT|nr:NifB/NifX family molybdenum-iron cluster-binding protein [Pararhodospirillum oryzae]GEO81878.1 hypothetical protein ROR02_20090 [Pararhodospirillum oryzae]